jgi:regulation of enolase protein 1 (concanavalin A-like superfamily)
MQNNTDEEVIAMPGIRTRLAAYQQNTKTKASGGSMAAGGAAPRRTIGKLQQSQRDVTKYESTAAEKMALQASKPKFQVAEDTRSVSPTPSGEPDYHQQQQRQVPHPQSPRRRMPVLMQSTSPATGSRSPPGAYTGPTLQDYVTKEQEDHAKNALNAILQKTTKDAKVTQSYSGFRVRYLRAVGTLRPVDYYTEGNDSFQEEAPDIAAPPLGESVASLAASLNADLRARRRQLRQTEHEKKGRYDKLKQSWYTYDDVALDKPIELTPEDEELEKDLDEIEEEIHDEWNDFTQDVIRTAAEEQEEGGAEDSDVAAWREEARKLKADAEKRKQRKEARVKFREAAMEEKRRHQVLDAARRRREGEAHHAREAQAREEREQQELHERAVEEQRAQKRTEQQRLEREQREAQRNEKDNSDEVSLKDETDEDRVLRESIEQREEEKLERSFREMEESDNPYLRKVHERRLKKRGENPEDADTEDEDDFGDRTDPNERVPIDDEVAKKQLAGMSSKQKRRAQKPKRQDSEGTAAESAPTAKAVMTRAKSKKKLMAKENDVDESDLSSRRNRAGPFASMGETERPETRRIASVAPSESETDWSSSILDSDVGRSPTRSPKKNTVTLGRSESQLGMTMEKQSSRRSMQIEKQASQRKLQMDKQKKIHYFGSHDNEEGVEDEEEDILPRVNNKSKPSAKPRAPGMMSPVKEPKKKELKIVYDNGIPKEITITLDDKAKKDKKKRKNKSKAGGDDGLVDDDDEGTLSIISSSESSSGASSESESDATPSKQKGEGKKDTGKPNTAEHKEHSVLRIDTLPATYMDGSEEHPFVAWTHKPRRVKQSGSQITVSVPPRTDCWRKTRHNFIMDNAPFHWHRVSGDFEVMVKINGDMSKVYDKAGIMVRLDEENWINTGVEFFNNELNHMTCVTRDYTDWSMAPLPTEAASQGAWVCIKRIGNSYESFSSMDGRNWRQARQGLFHDATSVRVGIFVACPMGEPFKVTFDKYRCKNLTI